MKKEEKKNLDKEQIPAEVKQRAKAIRLILMDVDGVMTGGEIVYDSSGGEIKHFDAHDGLGLKLAKYAGLKTGVVSARDSEPIRRRAAELQMDFLYLGSFKKIDALQDILHTHGIKAEHICYIGDDYPDIPILREAGLAVAVENATAPVKEQAHYITRRKGGKGAVREVVDLILETQQVLESAVKRVWEEG
ncbi:MAG: HAD family hydrolase [Calditrichia bacterium]